MIDKLKGYIGRFAGIAKQKLNDMQKPIKAVIIGYFAIVVLLVLTYYAAWLYRCYTGQIVMGDLLAIIREMIGPAMVGFVTFIGGCFVDLNNNGVPDRFEDDKECHRK